MRKGIVFVIITALVLQGLFATAIDSLDGSPKTTTTEVTFNLKDGEGGLNHIKIDFTEVDPTSYINDFAQTNLTSSDGITLTLDPTSTFGDMAEDQNLYVYWQIVSGSPLKIELSGEKMTGTTPTNTLDWKTSWTSKTSSGDGEGKVLGASGDSPSGADYAAELVYEKSAPDAVRQSGYVTLDIETAHITQVAPDTYSATLTLTVTDTSTT